MHIGAFGALVDLSGGIKKNEEMKKAAGASSQSAQSAQSFAGLDGFMKGSQVANNKFTDTYIYMIYILYVYMIYIL